MAVFRIDKTRDYTVMSNYHLRDERLSLKAKGLLSQMLSLPENWDYTLSGLSHINRESKDAIRSAVNELEKAGYVERRQTTDAQGKFSGNEYIIHEYPTGTEPSSENPSSDNPTTGKPTTEKPSSENPTQINTDKLIQEKENTDQSNTHSFFPSERTTEGQDLRRAIREQIEYDFLAESYDSRRLDELVEIMLEPEMNRSPTMRIGRNAEYPTGFVRERFRQLRAEHIERVMDGIETNTSQVKNTKAYLLAALFNAVSTLDAYYTMQVNHDFYGEP